MVCCSGRSCATFTVAALFFFGLFIALDVFYLSRPTCIYVSNTEYSLPASLIKTITYHNTTIMDKKSLLLKSRQHRAIECTLPTSLNQYNFEGVIDDKGRRDGPASIKTSGIDFDVWYSNDKANGPGVLRHKATMLDEEGLVVNGTWKDGKLNCPSSKPCELIMYLDKEGNTMTYIGPIKDYFLHGSSSTVEMKRPNTNDTDVRLPFKFQGISYKQGSLVEFDNKTHVSLSIQFPHNITKEFVIKRVHGLWDALMNRFSPTSEKSCQVLYTVKNDPMQEERSWDCNISKVEGELLSEEHHIKGAFISLIQFELYWSSKAMTRIPQHPIVMPTRTRTIIQSKDEL